MWRTVVEEVWGGFTNSNMDVIRGRRDEAK